MAWRGKFRKLDPEMLGPREKVVGLAYQSDEDGQVTVEVTIPSEFIEDDGRPFEDGEEVEFIVRRVNDNGVEMGREIIP